MEMKLNIESPVSYTLFAEPEHPGTYSLKLTAPVDVDLGTDDEATMTAAIKAQLGCSDVSYGSWSECFEMQDGNWQKFVVQSSLITVTR